MISYRALPRAFVSDLPNPLVEPFRLPDSEFKKFKNVLRLKTGDEIGILPGDGRFVRCQLDGYDAIPLETILPESEAKTKLILCLGIPKPDKLEESVRLATEMGVHVIEIFSSERTVVKWNQEKLMKRLERLKSIAREAAEVSFRTHLPDILKRESLKEVLKVHPQSQVLSEYENVGKTLDHSTDEIVLVVGPEGGWTRKEAELIGDRAITLGKRVLRVDTAVAAGVALALLNR